MADIIQFKRGLQADLPSSGLAGEPAFMTDSGLLVVYDGANQKLIGMAVSGLDASRPSAGIANRMYFATDTQLLYFDDGAQWVNVGAVTSSGLEELENNLILIAWDYYSQDVRFDDLAVDDLETETGIDTVNSVALYSAADDYYSKDAAGDIVLITNSWEASANDPDSAYAVLQIEPVDAITIGTDLKAWVSTDDGANYEELSSYELFLEIGTIDFVRCEASGLTPRTDKTMRLKVTGHNAKDFKIHGLSLGVKY